MSRKGLVLAPAAAKTYYDRFGEKQDSQGFYEDPALNDLIAHADFHGAERVFEFGCGTGKFATHLFEKHLSPTAEYLGFDVSPVMTSLAKRRLEAYGERAQILLSDGEVRFPTSDCSVDRVVCTYVLDLLSEADIRRFFSEARRVIAPGGKACIASLTRGISLPSRIVSSVWMWMFRLNPMIVGGCRPIDIDTFVDPLEWEVTYRAVVTPFGVPSEVLVLETQ